MTDKSVQNLILKIKVVPNASKNEIVPAEEGLKVRLTAPPVDGKANKCLVELLAKEYNVPKSRIEIIKGETSKNKTVVIMCNTM